MGVPFNPHGLEGVQIDLSHQEMERLVTELEAIWYSFTYNDEGPSGIEWLPVTGIARALCEDLGYEDIEEFEDALKCSFGEFLEKLPSITKKEQDGKEYFQIKPAPEKTAWRNTKMTLNITSTKDLWRVVLKSPNATIEVPELEFEISADGKKHIDSIYNHIAAAVFNLGQHVSQSRNTMSPDHQNKIMETVEQLNILLDVEKHWTLIVHDPSGTSEFKPDDGVLVDYPDEI